jgi:dUTP pyrophosphatase
MPGTAEQFPLLVRLAPGAIAPRRAHDHDAGFDLFCREQVVIAPGERVFVDTGVGVFTAADLAVLVMPRSGLARRHGITIVNAPGLVDPSYGGDVGVTLLNTSDELFRAAPGSAIAQLLLVPFVAPAVIGVGELPLRGSRGSAGFGSTG